MLPWNLSYPEQNNDELWLETFVQTLDLEANKASFGESCLTISRFLQSVSTSDLIRRNFLFFQTGVEILQLSDSAEKVDNPTSNVLWNRMYLGLWEITSELSRRFSNMSVARDKKEEEVCLLTDITNSIISSLDMKKIFHVITTKIAKLVNFDRASIVLIDEVSDNVLAFVLVTQSDSNYQEGAYQLRGTAQEWVLRHRRTCIDETLDNGLYRENRGLYEEGLRSSIRVPLFFRSKIIGTFNLDSRRVGAYSATEQRLLEQVAGQIAIAVENSRLYDEALRRTEEISAINSTLETMVQFQTAKVTELERKRAMLTGLIAHSLKSPIIGIRRALMMLAAENATYNNGNWEGLLDELCSSCDLLLGIVNDMLDVYRYEFDSVPLYLLEPVEISNPINKSILLLRHQIAEKHLNIAFQTEQGLYVTGDGKRLSRLFINLLENVVRYSPFYANVNITSSPVEEQNSRFIKISIEDEGPGIPEQDLARIFDQFYQVEKNASTESGSGLGLCYCKMIVEAHGGTIWAENRRQGGTAFYLLLPAFPDMPMEGTVINGN